MADHVTALIDAADELLSAQQALLGASLPPEIAQLTEAYLAARLAAMDGRVRGDE